MAVLGLCERCSALNLKAAIKELQNPTLQPEDGYTNELTVTVTTTRRTRKATTEAQPKGQGEESGDDNKWYTNIHQIASQSSYCTLCGLVIKGWRASRAATVDENLRSADLVNPDNPPEDFARDILEIECFDKEARVSVKVVRVRGEKDKSLREARDWKKGKVFLRFECAPLRMKSWEANMPLVAEFRVFRGDDDRGGGDDAYDDGEEVMLDVAVSADPLSESALKIISTWISNCSSYHGEACNNNNNNNQQQQRKGSNPTWPGLPSRILDVSPSKDTNIICLRTRDSIPDTEDRRYVTLSHCWGQLEKPFCTTRDNISDRMSAIRVSEMPKTFRDAVAVTRRLGLRYVWIDSLCIIQGDAEDWALEAADMSNVYSHCQLLLGAARGASDEAGFLQLRTQVDTVSLSIPTANPDADAGVRSKLQLQLQLQLLPPDSARWTSDNTIDPMGNEPLNARAWCLQERVLPTKKLFYGSAQMFWECPTLRESESGEAVDHVGHLGQIYRSGSLPTSVFLRCLSRKGRRVGGETEEEQESDYNDGRNSRWIDWYQMVEEYSTRSITKDDDRLVALGGLARLVARATAATYMAGIWDTGFIEGLMWSRSHHPLSLDNKEPLQAPSTYAAPSWSWASVIGPVQFSMYKWYSERSQWKARYSNFEPLAQYVGCSISPREYEDGFGRLREGYLTIRAPALLSVTAVRPRQESPVDTSLWTDMVPNRSPVTDIVLQLRYSGKDKIKKNKTLWIEGGLDITTNTNTENENHLDLSSVFVVFLARLPHVGSTGKVFGHYRYLEHRFGLILQKTTAATTATSTKEGDKEEGGGPYYRRIGFVDGFILQQRLFGLPALLGVNSMAREFESVSYQCDDASYEKDWASHDEINDEDDEPENKRGPNPLALDFKEVTLV